MSVQRVNDHNLVAAVSKPSPVVEAIRPRYRNRLPTIPSEALVSFITKLENEISITGLKAGRLSLPLPLVLRVVGDAAAANVNSMR